MTFDASDLFEGPVKALGERSVIFDSRNLVRCPSCTLIFEFKRRHAVVAFKGAVKVGQVVKSDVIPDLTDGASVAIRLTQHATGSLETLHQQKFRKRAPILLEQSLQDAPRYADLGCHDPN
jgi:hypothetical protein